MYYFFRKRYQGIKSEKTDARAGDAKRQAQPGGNQSSERKIFPELKEADPVERRGASFSSGSRILIIEDNPGVQRLISYCLKENYRLSFASNGREGLDRALHDIPELVICDLMMPKVGGYEVCKRLKEDERTSHIPVIILTALDDTDSKVKGLECGADAYLAKPFNGRELQVRVEQLLRLRKRLQEVYQQQMAKGERLQPDRSSGKQAFLHRFQELVVSQLSNPGLSVPELCRELGMSHTQLHRKIKQLTGISTIQVIKSIRIEKAKELLRQTDLNISEIAYQVGYNDPSYFGRVFVKATGCTPTLYREKEA